MSTPERASGDRALLRFLARQGRITSDDVTRVEGLLKEPGVTVHDILERENIIGQKDLARLLAETLRLRLVDLTTYPLDANVTRELKEHIATRYEVVPISIDERTIEVVTANPLDLEGMKAVEFATGKRVQAAVATHVGVKDALAHTYRLQESLEQFLQLVPVGEALVVNELSDDGGDLRAVAADAELPPVIKLADKMLIEGIKCRASDIHVEPGTDSVLVRYRVDGILEEAFRFPKWIQNPLVARLKVMAKLDITERRMPQDGRIQLRYQDKTVDMRVSSLPAQHGEKITLRILDASQAVKALDRLGLVACDLKIMRDAAKKPQGMILITGPTGSGKTTTLYALLREILSPKTNIVTIENPIEYQLKGINQVEVNEKQGLTFSQVLRSVLRQDPDVILLGEIRDKETARIAFQAASTGHLVLSTVHTNDAAGAVTRLLDLGLEPYAVSSAMNLVVAQRLVRQLCPNCSAPAEIDEETRRQLHLGDDASGVKRGVGCAQCRHSGYRSRTGVYEMLPMTTALAKLVEAGAGETMVRQQARSEGLHTMLEDAVEKLRTGITSVDELKRVVQITNDEGIQCPGCKKEIAEDYSVCPHCSKTLRAICSGCAKPLDPEWVRCPYCGVGAVEITGLRAEAAAAPAERRSFKALVADDTATIRAVVRHTLEHSDLGLTVLTAEDGPEALAIAERERPDIVILDISMPGMDGFEVCQRLRSEVRTAFVPVLMLTAHDSEEDVSRGFGVGADDYMVKPFRREGLLARVRRILERTYGSHAIGAAPVPELAPVAPPAPTGTMAMPSMDAQRAGIDLAAALAEFATDRDALRRRFESCETRIGELVARPIAEDNAANGSMAPDLEGLAELRGLLAETQTAQVRALRELRDETARAMARAEEALQTARASASSVPPAQFAAMLTTVERLQGEQTRLASAVETVRATGDGVDKECEKRLQQATQDMEQVRAGVEALQATWQRDTREICAESRTTAAEAWQRAQADTARLAESLGELRTEVEAQRHEQVRDGARMRSAEEQAGRAHAEVMAAAEKTARELAVLQRDRAEQQEQRQQDAQRLVSAEESARRARAEMLAAAEQMSEELATLRRALAEQRDGGLQIGARLEGAEEVAQQARAEMAATAARITQEIAAFERTLDAQRADRTAEGKRLESAEEAARSARVDVAAVTDRTERDLAELRDAVAQQHGAQQQELEWLQSRLGQARRTVVKVVRRVRAAAMAAEVRAVGRAQDCGQQVTTVREQTTAAFEALRQDHAELTRAVTVRLADLPSAAEHRTVMAFLDGCEAQLTEFAARLDAQGAVRAASDEESRQRFEAEVEGLKTVTDRLDGEQRRLAAEVEERLRGLMRTAAGGFDVQMALLRGKVEGLARTMRERVSVDLETPHADGMLEHRHGLMERLRQQLAALQTGTDWHPQRVLDLLLESTLAAAVTSFRLIMQLTEWHTSEEQEATAEAADATLTDESASLS